MYALANPFVFGSTVRSGHKGIDKRGIVAPCVLLVSTHFYPCGIYLGGLSSCLPELGSLPMSPCVSLVVVEIPVGLFFF